ncbi:NtaA/DmoA family FMN-dependent monooxygenase [Nesterenkonia alkaliphila]|uniref:NtaA/DmoA family FMN-dependent monooxygenase n=1 Tax=Nesterenkonia alkaliphila TaxID=1463631 RepID=A0A7K1UL84_9MICC|nr:NtaA/DmoA family FMN-dependent monooxygenase [Nesterenkonia alkaliphila]MVT27233.1 NtaA/DmoA family FMN-dependent monooxygenase [Nesterenkonia alkaliphila]GFZ78404.1 nitrilotriacetate monooxygenase component A [Nesterenkonia alkaliphila]
MSASPRQVILGAHFPGVNNTTVWSDPASGSHIAFDSFRRFAQAAERGRFDFLFLAEGLRLREQKGQIHDLDVVGRPDTLPVLAGLAAVTEHLGLAGTINATYNEPYEVARQFASLDHLSAGRAAWNVVTSSDAFTGENFRRGGYLPHDQRYVRAEEFVRAAKTIWDSWSGEEPDPFEYRSTQFSIEGRFNLPRPPQGHPVIFQAGDSAEGRDFAARNADAIFTRHSAGEEGRRFYADVKARAERYGRDPDSLKVLPGISFIIGDTDQEAEEIAAEVRAQQVSGQTAILILERLWNRDLSGYDPEGPLPEIDPDPDGPQLFAGRTRQHDDVHAEVATLRRISAEQGLNLRQTVIATQARQSLIGSPATVAQQIIEAVKTRVSDGFILVPHITPAGLDPFVDKVVPLLQERGALRSEYPQGALLRDLLGLGVPGSPCGGGAETGAQALSPQVSLSH